MPYTTTDRHHHAPLGLEDEESFHDEDLFVSEQPSVLLHSADLRVSAVIPARNEAKNLAYVFGRLPADLHEVILVNGHSADDTVAEALRLRADVRVIEQEGRGKGDALSAGFAACTGDVIVMLDADGSTDPREIPRFVAALTVGADFVKGSRYAQGGGSSDLTPPRRFGNGLVNSLYGTSYTDLCYGYNAFWRRCLPYIRLDVPGFEVETLINVRIARAGLSIQEVPSYERLRLEGVSNLKAVRDGLHILRTIVLECLRISQRHALQRRRAGVVVQEGHHVAEGVRQAGVARAREPGSALAGKHPRGGRQRRDGALQQRLVVVDHHHHLARGMRLQPQRAHGLGEPLPPRPRVGADDDAEGRRLALGFHPSMFAILGGQRDGCRHVTWNGCTGWRMRHPAGPHMCGPVPHRACTVRPPGACAGRDSAACGAVFSTPFRKAYRACREA